MRRPWVKGGCGGGRGERGGGGTCVGAFDLKFGGKGGGLYRLARGERRGRVHCSNAVRLGRRQPGSAT
jgi:hypothetical protein